MRRQVTSGESHADELSAGRVEQEYLLDRVDHSVFQQLPAGHPVRHVGGRARLHFYYREAISASYKEVSLDDEPDGLAIHLHDSGPSDLCLKDLESFGFEPVPRSHLARRSAGSQSAHAEPPNDSRSTIRQPDAGTERKESDDDGGVVASEDDVSRNSCDRSLDERLRDAVRVAIAVRAGKW